MEPAPIIAIVWMFMWNLLPLNQHGYGITAPQAECGQSSAQTSVFQCMEQGYENTRSAGTEWVTKCDCSAMDVKFSCIDIQLPGDGYGSGGICLVVLHNVYIGHGKP